MLESSHHLSSIITHAHSSLLLSLTTVPSSPSSGPLSTTILCLFSNFSITNQFLELGQTPRPLIVRFQCSFDCPRIVAHSKEAAAYHVADSASKEGLHELEGHRHDGPALLPALHGPHAGAHLEGELRLVPALMGIQSRRTPFAGLHAEYFRSSEFQSPSQFGNTRFRQ